MASTHHAPLVREPLLLDIIGGDTDWSTDKLPDDDIPLPVSVQLADIDEDPKKEPVAWMELGLQAIG
ncbi:signal peptide-containing [Micractinium conductrix]|uniref:Signal peptide-containing n=1 Tax=Micractinium conductrix TaxID=554055 RepID=A0A2P6V918_9CHLO|nr:signal peptide-containing [Micractinium conductrix]|eukprot:PSC70578.1 signal peptide-containing [Micractinium conductrix]